MKLNKTFSSILLFSAISAVAFASDSVKSVTMTRQEASNLHTALSSVQYGLSPADTMAAADDINALLPAAQALQKGQQAASRVAALIPDGPDKQAKQIAILTEIEKKGEEQVTLELTPIDISADEIKEAKITPSILSVLRRFLAPPKPKP